jgi:hypothetical protein
MNWVFCQTAGRASSSHCRSRSLGQHLLAAAEGRRETAHRGHHDGEQAVHVGGGGKQRLPSLEVMPGCNDLRRLGGRSGQCLDGMVRQLRNEVCGDEDRRGVFQCRPHAVIVAGVDTHDLDAEGSPVVAPTTHRPGSEPADAPLRKVEEGFGDSSALASMTPTITSREENEDILVVLAGNLGVGSRVL